MSHASLDLDDELVEKAGELSGTRTKDATVHAALADVADRAGRADFVAWLASGVLPDLADLEVTKKAWR